MVRIISNQRPATIDGGNSSAAREHAVKSVLFVCQGNVCRSPAGEAVFTKYLAQQDLLTAIRIDSAGVCVDENPPKPSFAMRWAAFRRGYRLKNQPRHIQRADLNTFDLVIAMDTQNRNALRMLCMNPKSTIKLLSDFLPARWPSNVPDPMYQSLKMCNWVFDALETACPNITAYLLRESLPVKNG